MQGRAKLGPIPVMLMAEGVTHGVKINRLLLFFKTFFPHKRVNTKWGILENGNGPWVFLLCEYGYYNKQKNCKELEKTPECFEQVALRNIIVVHIW